VLERVHVPTLIQTFALGLQKFSNLVALLQIVMNNLLKMVTRIFKLPLKYVDGQHAIRGINRVSTPGRRTYCGYREIPRVLGGLGISILSTPNGIIDDKTARKNKLGGEILCSVW
jgi:ribosomal protein S8